MGSATIGVHILFRLAAISKVISSDSSKYCQSVSERWQIFDVLHSLHTLADSKPLAISRSVDHAGVGLSVADLMPAFGERVLTVADQFVFPTCDEGIGKPSPELGKNFGGWRKDQSQSIDARGKFG